MTCARCRPLKEQRLGAKHFMKEHTKPLFKKHSILALRNLYTYYTLMEVSKILKLRSPICIYSHFNISHRKQTMIISSSPTANFVSRSSNLWNTIAPKLKLTDHSYKITSLKNTMKRCLLNLQHAENPLTWTSGDFDISKFPSLSLQWCPCAQTSNNNF